MKLSMMMTGRSPIITLKKLLSPKTTWTVSMSSLISTTSWRLKYLKLNNFYNFRQAETDATTLDAAIPKMGGDNTDTRQMIFNTIQKQEKEKISQLEIDNSNMSRIECLQKYLQKM